MRDSIGAHLDLDALADVLAGVLADGEPAPAHLSSCEACQSRLAELSAALPAVSADLAALPPPVPPVDLPERLASALAKASQPGTADVVPLVPRRTRWLPALGAAAAAAVLVTGGVLLAQGGGDAPTTSDLAAGAPQYAVNATGTDYSAKGNALAAALPGLLSGQAGGAEMTDSQAGPVPTAQQSKSAQRATGLSPASADPLAELRTTAGLARCLASLTDPADTGLPLALDYASFEGKPALVVVLPSSKPDKVDVMVVPAGCAQADGQVLFFTRLPRP